MQAAFRIISVILLASLLSASSALSQAFKTESGTAEFTSSVPLHSFTGTSHHLVGKISLPDSTVDFYLDLNTLDTGNNKRDKDMYETLESEKYPFAEFYGKLVTPFNPDTAAVQKVKVRGTFSIHGASREMVIEGTLQQTGNGLKVTASWTLDLSNYNIKPPGILFYRVDEEVDIAINATLKPI